MSIFSRNNVQNVEARISENYRETIELEPSRSNRNENGSNPEMEPLRQDIEAGREENDTERRIREERKRTQIEKEYQDTAIGIWFILFSWLNPQMEQLTDPERSRTFTPNDIKKCVYRERAKKNHKIWDQQCGNDFLYKFWRFVRFRLIFATILHILSIVSGFLTLSVAFDKLLLYINEAVNSENQFEMENLNETATVLFIEAVRTHDRSKAVAAAWFQWLIFFELFRAFTTSTASIVIIRTSIRANQALICALYERYFRIPQPNTDLLTLNREIKVLYNMIQALPYIVGYCFTFVLAIGYSFKILGFHYLWTLGMFSIFIIFHCVISYMDKRNKNSRDGLRKLSFMLLSNIIENFRTFKVFAIEKPIKSKLSDYKKKELKIQKEIIFFNLNWITLIMFRPLFLTVLSVIFVPALCGEIVAVEDMFRILIINYWCVHLPRMFSDHPTIFFEGKKILQKWNKNFAEQKQNRDITDEQRTRMEEENLCFEFKWKQRQNTSSNHTETIKIEKGSKICVESKRNTNEDDLLRFLAGFNSQGTDLLTNGQVIFMPAKPWIISGTIQDNIVFGNIQNIDERNFDMERYNKVLEICELKKSEENGTDEIDTSKVSTGETHRISLARALYSQADIYIFEQFLSSVDTEMAARIVDKLEKDSDYKDKTIIYSSDKYEQYCFKHNFSFLILDNDGYFPVDEDIIDFVDASESEIDSEPTINLFDDRKRMLNTLRRRVAPFTLFSKANQFDNMSYHILKDIQYIRDQRVSRLFVDRSQNDARRELFSQSPPTITEDVRNEKTTSWATFHELKKIWHIFVLHILIGSLYQLANFNLNFIPPLYIYAIYFFVLLSLHFLLSIIYTEHCEKRLYRFYDLFLQAFFNTSLSFLEKESNAQWRTVFSDDISFVENNNLNKFNHILFRFFGAVCSLCFIYYMIAYPVIFQFGHWKHQSLSLTMFSFILIVITFLYPFIVILWIWLNFSKFRNCLKLLGKANKELYSRVEGYFNDSVKGHETIYINRYMNSVRADDDDSGTQRRRRRRCRRRSKIRRPEMMNGLYKRLDHYQGANWLQESMTHWLNIRIDLFLIGYIVVLWIYGVWFVEELGETWTILLIIFAMIINYFLQYVILNLFRFYNDLVSFRRVIEYRETMKKMNEFDGVEKICKNIREDFNDGNIVFKDVEFSYPNNENIVILNGINLTIKAGDRVCITGPSGAGKTSLINVFSRLFDYHGEILVNNKNIQSYDLHCYRSSISIIPQNLKLFMPTLVENIDPDTKYTDNNIKTYLKETGYETNNGGADNIELYSLKFDKDNISDNSIKSIYLTKAILDQRPILILDEFPQQLHNDKSIFDIFDDYFPNTTIIFITHDETVSERFEDNYYKFNNGQICKA